MKEHIQDEKKALRRQILRVRDALTEEERAHSSDLMKERILEHPWYLGSDIVLGFVSFGSEIDTKKILSAALQAGKQVFVPKIITRQREMHFYRIGALDELREGFHGILEPAGDSECFVYREGSVDKTLMLMPGVAFDRDRNRMGYGGGFYDTFLKGKELLAGRTIAVGFACQMVERVPVDGRDVKPAQVICIEGRKI